MELIGTLLPTVGDVEITLSPAPEYSMLKLLNNFLASVLDNPITLGTSIYLVS